jgi:hypothetical protein
MGQFHYRQQACDKPGQKTGDQRQASLRAVIVAEGVTILRLLMIPRLWPLAKECADQATHKLSKNIGNS